jgi:hypothetical protein
MKRIVVVLLAVMLLLAMGAGPGPVIEKRTWKYTVLTQLSFPTLKQSMWAGPDKEMDAALKVPEALNLMGADGWELISVISDHSGREPYLTSFYFKRPQ